MRLRSAYDRFLKYLLAFVLIILVTAGFSLLRGVLDDTVVALLLLIPVGVITARWGLGPGITAALTAFLAFNYLFFAPYYTFIVHRPGDLGCASGVPGCGRGDEPAGRARPGRRASPLLPGSAKPPSCTS